MELINYSKSNCLPSKGKPLMRITFDRGIVILNKSFTQIANLNAGDKIMLHQDKNNLKDWYISKSHDDDEGFTLRKHGNTQLRFYSKTLVSILMKSLSLEGQSGIFKLSPSPIDGKYFAILTSSYKRYKNEI